MGLQISIRKSGEVTILDLRGSSTIDYGGSDLLYRHLQGLVGDGVRNLLLNLEELTQVDSSAISVIVETYVFLKRKGGYLKLLRPCGRVLTVLRLFQLLRVISSFDDEAMALASFQLQGYVAKP
ncbi:MAG TPA: STAS domain-containing protein [Terriglobales bacterium]|nr:STAS domain-containing protein [Terriglobales bacterium]